MTSNTNLEISFTDEEKAELERLEEKYKYASHLWHITFPTASSNKFTIDFSDAMTWRDLVVEKRQANFPGASASLRRKLNSLFEKAE